MISFANPLGFLALLGIPAVLAIHLLQRKAVQIPSSTLFLLERTHRDSMSGRRIERLVPSIPLWMQLLAVLLLTWLMVEPRFQRANSVQRIAIVLDSSASMSVFKTQAIDRLTDALGKLRGRATGMEITVLESVAGRPRVYAGSSIEDLRAALEKWQPRDGLVDPAQSLRLARSLVSGEGSVLYLTDTPVDSLPFDARLLAVGEPVDNVGFTGVSFTREEGAWVWRALVRNYGSKTVERTWSVYSAESSTQPQPFTLTPGALVTLQAAFPENADRVRVVLDADRFTLDDVLPLVRPSPKPLQIFAATSPAFEELMGRLLRSLDAATPTNDAATADLSLVAYDPLDPAPPAGNAVVFVEDGTSAGAYLTGGIVAESHPLMEGLHWQSLLVRETLELERLPGDTVLLWQDQRPLIFLREKDHQRQLCFNFDPRLSNALQQSAFIVLLHRFAERLRDAKIAPFTAMLETGQPVSVTAAPNEALQILQTDLEGQSLSNATLLPSSQTSFRIPPNDLRAEPGYLTIRQNERELLHAAIHFADAREADLTGCASEERIDFQAVTDTRRHTEADPYWRFAVLGMLVALLIAWKCVATSRSRQPAPI